MISGPAAAVLALRPRWLRWPRATWVLADQAVLSLGTFLLSVALARSLSLETFGTYALFVSALPLAQTFGNAVIFYPLSVRATVLPEPERRRLIRATFKLTLLAGAPLALLFGIVNRCFVDPALLLPSACLLLSSQIQECTRRGLLCAFRHRAAIMGDAVSYLGQVLLVVALARVAALDLAVALYAAAATSVVGALLQSVQIGLWRRDPGPVWPVRATLRDYWTLGRWSLGSNALLALRGGVLPWLLASFHGPVAAGTFQLAVNVVNVANPVVIGIANVIPQAAARGRSGGARAALRLSLPYIATGLPIVGLLSLGMILAPERILDLVYARSFADPVLFEAVRIMAVGAVFGFLAAGAGAHLYGSGDGRIAFAGDAATGLAVLAAAVPLVGALGLLGACVAAALSLVARTAWMTAVVARRLAQERDRPAPSSPTIAAMDRF
ncbi:lipopolysaccharide biosynthesis protein [Aureimonas sp. AU4]|uniref:lipopolysaccharide biosynthesis protein n=1 Tax=Aureimonas sp. AU4 TaxID=1638163 RepID=UPI000780C55B|nr:hypothetical protein [Aureimonas sp. AU4]